MTRHDDIRLRLDDFVDHELPADQQDDVSLHLAGCAECAAEVDAIHRLRAAALDLPAGIEPDEDLWGGIEARLDASPLNASERAARAVPAWTAPLTWAAAAAIAVLLVWPRGGDEAPFRELTQTYDSVRHDGEIALSRDDIALNAGGRGTVTEGMAAIDDAIRETQAALEAVADAPEQFRHLADGYQKKIDLLQRLVRRAAQT